MKHVVVIGGGFAGLSLIKHLSKDMDITITLVDRNNYTCFPPLFYQVATGVLESSNICYPFRKMFQKLPNVGFRMGEFLRVLPQENKVVLSTGELTYDHLVIAAGASPNFFGMENIRRQAFPLKSLDDALRLRNHLLGQMELASVQVNGMELASLPVNDREIQKYLTVVIVGTGPTGVEIAGMLADLRRNILLKDYPELERAGHLSRIILVDAGDHVLGAMSKQTQAYGYRTLSEMMIDIRFGMQVKDFVDDKLLFSNGQEIETKTLIWAAGIRGARYEGLPSDAFGAGGRIKVDACHRVHGTDNIYALGDISLQDHEPKYPAGHPQVAQVAIQQGINLAKQLVNARLGAANGRLGAANGRLSGKPFRYHDKGAMAIIGGRRAVVDLPGGQHFRGTMAWLMWLCIHLLSLIHNRNRVTTFFNWTVGLFTRDQALRLLIRPSEDPINTQVQKNTI